MEIMDLTIETKGFSGFTAFLTLPKANKAALASATH
jgi:hypothetical protein